MWFFYIVNFYFKVNIGKSNDLKIIVLWYCCCIVWELVCLCKFILIYFVGIVLGKV